MSSAFRFLHRDAVREGWPTRWRRRGSGPLSGPRSLCRCYLPRIPARTGGAADAAGPASQAALSLLPIWQGDSAPHKSECATQPYSTVRCHTTEGSCGRQTPVRPPLRLYSGVLLYQTLCAETGLYSACCSALLPRFYTPLLAVPIPERDAAVGILRGVPSVDGLAFLRFLIDSVVVCLFANSAMLRSSGS
jgi:hypothetical protein